MEDETKKNEPNGDGAPNDAESYIEIVKKLMIENKIILFANDFIIYIKKAILIYSTAIHFVILHHHGDGDSNSNHNHLHLHRHNRNRIHNHIHVLQQMN